MYTRYIIYGYYQWVAARPSKFKEIFHWRVRLNICVRSCFRISMETAAMGGMAGFQYIAPNHIIKTQLHWSKLEQPFTVNEKRNFLLEDASLLALLNVSSSSSYRRASRIFCNSNKCVFYKKLESKFLVDARVACL